MTNSPAQGRSLDKCPAMGTHNLINDQQMWGKVVTLGTNQAISQGLDNETWQNLKKNPHRAFVLG